MPPYATVPADRVRLSDVASGAPDGLGEGDADALGSGDGVGAARAETPSGTIKDAARPPVTRAERRVERGIRASRGSRTEHER
jgi:hypothetical protein